MVILAQLAALYSMNRKVEVLAMPMEVRRKAKHKFVPPNTCVSTLSVSRQRGGHGLGGNGLGKIHLWYEWVHRVELQPKGEGSTIRSLEAGISINEHNKVSLWMKEKVSVADPPDKRILRWPGAYAINAKSLPEGIMVHFGLKLFYTGCHLMI